MARSIDPNDLSAAIENELTMYGKNVRDGINSEAEKAIKNLVKRTRATAPVGARGSYKKNIAQKKIREGVGGIVYAWYVKPPDHRLTHLLVRGHATRDGGRTRGNAFLADAVAEVLPEYERKVEEVARNGG